MPDKNDLIFRMSVEPDTARMSSAILEIGKSVNAEAKKMTDAWAKLGSESSLSFVAQDRITKGLSAAAAETNLQLDATRKVTSELETQARLLVEIKAASDPALLKKRVALENEIAKARKSYEDSLGKERASQIPTVHPADELPKSIGGKIKEMLGTVIGDSLNKMLGNVGNIVGDAAKVMLGTVIGDSLNKMLGNVGNIVGDAAKVMLGSGKGGSGTAPKGVGGGSAAGDAAGGAEAGEAATGEAVGGAALGAVDIPLAVVAVAVVAAKKGLEALASGLRKLQDDLGPVGILLDKIPIFGDVLRDITSSLVAMTAKGSPAVFQQWQRSLEDVQGVIGQTFIPVLQLMTDAVRFFGDVLATILPTTKEMGSVLEPLKEGWIQLKAALSEAVADIGPLVKEFALESLKTGLQLLGAAFTGLAYSIKFLLFPITALMKLLGISQGNLTSSVGAAAAQATISSSEEYQKNLQLAAYSQPAGVGGDSAPIVTPLDRIANIAQAILSIMQNPTQAIASGAIQTLTPPPVTWIANLVNNILG